MATAVPRFFIFWETYTLSTLLAPSTELEAVNRMLGSIGQTPVNTLEVSGIPDVTRALRFLRETLKDLEAAGWSWNTDRNYQLQPDPDGYIAIPTGALEVDPEDVSLNVSIRRNPETGDLSLYDADEQTFVFEEPVEVSVIWGFPFEDVPQAARTYVAIAASRKFQAQTVSSSSLDKFNEMDEQRAWNLLKRMERRVRDTNVFRVNASAQRAMRRRF
ncbi:hypothetical protein [Sphingopyxis flava]|uniref:Tail tubular protein A n=1 Tax=Sphingopyxis flava TaxID=1507287 RepID=A0A1T5BQW7_9SPHN|nr:hypothetical protein [Sphingopyxis flava]SKB49772.1 hypothetical protein SAMN06295937_100771 [Sphingopyxis flava]